MGANQRERKGFDRARGPHIDRLCTLEFYGRQPYGQMPIIHGEGLAIETDPYYYIGIGLLSPVGSVLGIVSVGHYPSMPSTALLLDSSNSHPPLR